MTGVIIAIVVIVVVVAIIIGVWMYMRQRKSKELQKQFGPEYERVTSAYDGKREGELEIERRAKRVEKLDIRPLTPEEYDRFNNEWQQVQAEFVDDPGQAIGDADSLINQVMQTRGYPMDDFDQRASDLSVNYPDVVQNYREAHGIAVRNQNGEASTEDLRQAMVHYRSLFQELLETAQPTEVKR